MANTHASTTALETTSASETHTQHVQEEKEPASEDAIAHDEPTEVTPAKASTVVRPATTADPDDEAETPVAEATDSTSQSDDDIVVVTEAVRRLEVSHSTYARFNDGHVVTGPGWNGPRYTSLSGNVFDTTNPPPQECLNCHGNHWRKNCPHGLKYKVRSEGSDKPRSLTRSKMKNYI